MAVAPGGLYTVDTGPAGRNPTLGGNPPAVTTADDINKTAPPPSYASLFGKLTKNVTTERSTDETKRNKELRDFALESTAIALLSLSAIALGIVVLVLDGCKIDYVIRQIICGSFLFMIFLMKVLEFHSKERKYKVWFGVIGGFARIGFPICLLMWSISTFTMVPILDDPKQKCNINNGLYWACFALAILTLVCSILYLIKICFIDKKKKGK